MPKRLIIALLAGAASGAPAAASVGVKQITTGLTQPVYLTYRGNNLIVVQQNGQIVQVNRSNGARSPFFTVPNIEVGGEKGLLGLAFDPLYPRNGRFYVNVTARFNGQLVTEVRRYTNPAIATEASSVVIRVNQPYDNHNGGWLDFGADKRLYVALGDGGSANDPQNNAQNLSSNLGKMLRLDVTRDAFPADPARNYAIPSGNPFGTEIYAYGLRNPYRAGFDRTTGTLWIGDVGQGAREEIDTIAAGTGGQNFGWRALEGSIRTPGVSDPLPANAVAPVFEYNHGIGQSITGGYVYRGSSVTDLVGRYVFGDFVAGKLFSIGLDGSGFTDFTSALGGFGPINPSSFGLDGNNQLYVIDYGGRIFRFQNGAAAASGARFSALAAVPEPGVWAMLIAGFGLVGAAMRRQRVTA